MSINIINNDIYIIINICNNDVPTEAQFNYSTQFFFFFKFEQMMKDLAGGRDLRSKPKHLPSLFYFPLFCWSYGDVVIWGVAFAHITPSFKTHWCENQSLYDSLIRIEGKLVQYSSCYKVWLLADSKNGWACRETWPPSACFSNSWMRESSTALPLEGCFW